MKKIILLLLILIFIPAGSFVVAQTYTASIGEENLQIKKGIPPDTVEIFNVEIIEIDGADYVGLRDMAQKFDAEIEWLEQTKGISVKKTDLDLLFHAEKNIVMMNDTELDMGFPIVLRQGTSYAPLDTYKLFISENATVGTGSVGTGSAGTGSAGTGSAGTGSAGTGSAGTGSAGTGSAGTGSAGTGSGIYVEKAENADKITIKAAFEDIKRCFELSAPNRLVVDIQGFEIPETTPDGSTFTGIRHSVDSKGLARLVFDLAEDYSHSLIKNGDTVVIIISKDGTFPGVMSNIEFIEDSVHIKTGNYGGYVINRSSNPFTVNVWIPDEITNMKTTMETDGEFIKSITSQPMNGGSYIQIETVLQCVFGLEKKRAEFMVKIGEPVVKNLDYFNKDGNRIEAAGTGINDISDISYSKDSTTAVIEIKDPEGDVTEGQVYINDEVVKNIFVRRAGKNAIIEIEGKKAFAVNAVAFESSVIFHITDAKYKDMKVVISAGHGGRDPGAVRGSIYESHINLAMAKKLEELLAKAGVPSYMIRTDDTYVSLDDRVDTANRLNADLFISIHCNTFHDPLFDGLMTLVHYGKIDYQNINGRTAGVMIHEKLIEATGAVDRGVRFRDKIVVLRETSMPAVEIEAGLLTNEAELVKLLDDSYQWLIAAGAARGITEVLDLMLN